MTDFVPNRPTYLKESPSQTAGPYIHIGSNPNWVEITGVWAEDLGLRLVDGETQGERIVIDGIVLDGDGEPLRDALVEIWQADAAGLYPSANETRGTADPHFAGWGRVPTDETTGGFRFETVKPGPVPFADGRMMAPHVTVWIAARGINLGLQTRLYFADEAEANGRDPVLAKVPPHRVETLMAHPLPNEPEGSEATVYRFVIRLQGEGETVFFDV